MTEIYYKKTEILEENTHRLTLLTYSLFQLQEETCETNRHDGYIQCLVFGCVL